MAEYTNGGRRDDGRRRENHNRNERGSYGRGAGGSAGRSGSRSEQRRDDSSSGGSSWGQRSGRPRFNNDDRGERRSESRSSERFDSDRRSQGYRGSGSEQRPPRREGSRGWGERGESSRDGQRKDDGKPRSERDRSFSRRDDRGRDDRGRGGREYRGRDERQGSGRDRFGADRGDRAGAGRGGSSTPGADRQSSDRRGSDRYGSDRYGTGRSREGERRTDRDANGYRRNGSWGEGRDRDRDDSRGHRSPERKFENGRGNDRQRGSESRDFGSHGFSSRRGDSRGAAPDSRRRDDSAHGNAGRRFDSGETRLDSAGREINARDLRRANRPDRERSPEIDHDVTGAELDRVTRAQLRTLESKNGEWAAKHLVMAGRLIDDDPQLAFQHALAASRRAGRLAAVREAVALTAYAAEDYAEALREFRTYRRISGSPVHLPLIADCQRGLGRPEKAVEVADDPQVAELDSAGKVELAMVVAGAYMDLGQNEKAIAALEIPQLQKDRAFSFSPRLFTVYADVLAASGRADEAKMWRKQATLAEEALQPEDDEPEIFDLVPEADDEAGFAVDSDAESAPHDERSGDERSGNQHEELTGE